MTQGCPAFAPDTIHIKLSSNVQTAGQGVPACFTGAVGGRGKAGRIAYSGRGEEVTTFCLPCRFASGRSVICRLEVLFQNPLDLEDSEFVCKNRVTGGNDLF